MTTPLGISKFEVASSQTAPAAPRWFNLADAAQVLGMSERHLRRLCGERLHRDGLARFTQTNGQKPFWEISSTAEPRLRAVAQQEANGGAMAVVEVQVDALLSVSAKARNWAQEKTAIVNRWQQRVAAARTLQQDVEAVTQAFIAELDHEFRAAGRKGAPSRRTLYNWAAAVAEGGGVEGAIDGRQRGRDSVVKAGDPFLECIKHLWLKPTAPKLSSCYAAALCLADEKGWNIRSLSMAKRFVQSIDRRLVVRLRQGPQAYTNQVSPHHQRDYTVGESNQVWVADDHTFDVLVKVGEKLNPKSGALEPIYRRPYLTGWLDMRSRKLVGHVISVREPNADTILSALCQGCLSHYVPQCVYTDNGENYDNQILTGETKAQKQKRKSEARARRARGELTPDELRLEGVYAALGVSHTHAIKFHPQSKLIERFFGTLCSDFARMWPTYTGNTPANKPEGLNERVAAGEAPTLAEFEAAFGKWLAAYHADTHRGHGMDQSPNDAWTANLRTKRVASRPVLELLCQPRVPRRVNQLGVEYAKLTYGRYVLNSYIGRELWIRVNNADVSSVSVWTERDEFICMAPANERLPMQSSIQDLRDAQHELQAFNKKVREAWNTGLRMHMDLPSAMLNAAVRKAEVAAQRPQLPAPAPEPHLQLVRPDLEEQSKALQAAHESGLRLLSAGTDDDASGTGANGFMEGGSDLNAIEAAYSTGGDDE